MGHKRHQVDFSGGDDLVIGLSACLLIYCLTWPFLMASFSVFNSADQGVGHRFPGALVVLVSLIILGVGYDYHHDRRPIIIGIAGMVLVIVNVTLPVECCSAINAWAGGSLGFSDLTFLDWFNFLVAPFGLLLLIRAHISNRTILTKHNAKRTRR